MATSPEQSPDPYSFSVKPLLPLFKKKNFILYHARPISSYCSPPSPHIREKMRKKDKQKKRRKREIEEEGGDEEEQEDDDDYRRTK